MTIEKVLSIENNRTIQNIGTIYLIRDNQSSPWYKAYELSAYLLEFFPNNSSDKKLKPIKRQYNNFGNVICVSLQLSSLPKYMPGVSGQQVSEPDIVLLGVDGSLYSPAITIDNFNTALSAWKDSIDLAETKKAQQNSSSSQLQNQKVYKSSEIESAILGFQYYNKSQDDLINFILQIKNMCASRI